MLDLFFAGIWSTWSLPLHKGNQESDFGPPADCLATSNTPCNLLTIFLGRGLLCSIDIAKQDSGHDPDKSHTCSYSLDCTQHTNSNTWAKWVPQVYPLSLFDKRASRLQSSCQLCVASISSSQSLSCIYLNHKYEDFASSIDRLYIHSSVHLRSWVLSPA